MMPVWGQAFKVEIPISFRVGAVPTEAHPHPPWMRISLPRHDLLGEEIWPISQRRRALSQFLNGLSIGFNLHRNTGKAHQSLSGSKDQTIDNKEL